MEVFIVAEIQELEKNVEEGELTEDALEGAAGGCGPVTFATVFSAEEGELTDEALDVSGGVDASRVRNPRKVPSL
jgi:hypothetical protein